MRVVIGVDPGASGALAVSVDGRLEIVVDMPSGPNASGKGERVQPAVLSDFVRDWQFRWSPSSALYVAVIERVAAMPSQGVSSMFAFGSEASRSAAVATSGKIGNEVRRASSRRRNSRSMELEASDLGESSRSGGGCVVEGARIVTRTLPA